jgi:hypothetical protein
MSLSKKQIVAASSATGFVLAAGVLGWFLYDAFTGRGEQEEELAVETASFQRFNDAPVFPSAKTIAEAKTNQAVLASWLEGARAYAARGDTKVAEETPPIFKQRLTKTVAKMRSLPGAAAGHLAGSGFMFGFDAYLGEGGVLPDVKDVPRLAAQLDVIKHVVVTLARAGALEIKEVRRVEAPPPDDQQAKGAKKKSKPKKDKTPEGPMPTSLEFGFVFTARPDALVKTLNAFSADNRFIVVKNLAFKMTEDDIVSRMDAADAAKAAAASAAASGGGRRRRRNAEVQQTAGAPGAAQGEAAVPTLVADPEAGSPMQVDLTLVVWDFGTGGINESAAPAKAAADAAKTGAAPGKDGSAAPKKAVTKEASK